MAGKMLRGTPAPATCACMLACMMSTSAPRIYNSSGGCSDNARAQASLTQLLGASDPLRMLHQLAQARHAEGLQKSSAACFVDFSSAQLSSAQYA